MFTLAKPKECAMIDYLLAQRGQPFSYADVGASATGAPDGFVLDHERVLLGHGCAVFQMAVSAIRSWKMFPTEMAELCFPDRPVAEETIVAVLFRGPGFWSLNPARIVYVTDEQTGAVRRFGFAYGTLPDHLACGEERFLVEWQQADDSVWYDLRVFSRPQSWLAWFGYPLVRRAQRRFRTLSASAMRQAVAPADIKGSGAYIG